MSSVVLRLVIVQQTINNKHTEYGHFGSLEVGFPHQMVRSVPTAIPVAYTSRCNRFTMIPVMSNKKHSQVWVTLQIFIRIENVGTFRAEWLVVPEEKK